MPDMKLINHHTEQSLKQPGRQQHRKRPKTPDPIGDKAKEQQSSQKEQGAEKLAPSGHSFQDKKHIISDLPCKFSDPKLFHLINRTV